jgi:hypothetical protein
MHDADHQRREAMNKGNAKRSALAAMRRQLRSGEVDLADVLLDPPDCLRHLSLIDVVACRYHSPHGGHWRAVLGRKAVHAGVNLVQPIGMASEHSRRWTAQHVRAQRGSRS